MTSAATIDRSLIHLVTQHWRFLRWRDRRRMLRVFASMEDARRFRHLPNCQYDVCEPVGLRLRGLSDATMYARPGTTDAKVLWDVFYHGFHRPPRGRRSIRRILDLGANVGFSAADLAVQCPNAEIAAVEMDSENATMCRRNTAHLGRRCQVIEAAVWSRGGALAYDGDEAWSLSVRSETDASRRGAAGRVAQAKTIDQILDEVGWDRVDFVKMDIEGAEAEVLRCADAWMDRVNVLKVELHAPAEDQTCRRVLSSLGFHCQRDRQHPNAMVVWRRWRFGD